MNSPSRPRPARATLPTLATLSAAVMLVAGCGHQAKTVRPAAAPAPNPPAAAPAHPAPEASSAPSMTPSRAPSEAVPTPRTQAGPLPRLPRPYLPLWPFATGQEVRAWQDGYLAGGHQPWHLSAQQTALSFTRNFLGYTEVDSVVDSTSNAVHAQVAVGFQLPDKARFNRAAVIHLVRFGTGRLAPWEVVGTDDTTFSLTAPSYGSRVSAPVTVGGRITGVDESIRVQIRQTSSGSVLGRSPNVPAGGQNAPWSTTVAFRGAIGHVLVIAAATGGHIAGVERFAVTGVVR